jgi:methionyl-tRNA formyltransferase
MTKNIIILTGNELRHTYVRKALAVSPGIKVLRSYCEGKSITMSHLVENREGPKTLQTQHLEARNRSEQDFFQPFVDLTDDRSNPTAIQGKEINEDHHIQDIIDLNPDVLIAYGCSLIKGRLLDHFKGRFLNVHLGLSPYYRGAGTNFWPLVNNEPEFVGATYMHIDAGIDTGEIIHQVRATVYPGDMPHQIGNRLIADIPFTYAALIREIDTLKPMPQPELNREEHYYRRKDFAEDNTAKLYENFKNGMIENYLINYEDRIANAPITEYPNLKRTTKP